MDQACGQLELAICSSKKNGEGSFTPREGVCFYESQCMSSCWSVELFPKLPNFVQYCIEIFSLCSLKYAIVMN